MTEGTSQGLFIVVAIVIFGIFVSLSYTLFGKTLQPQVVSVFNQSLETVNTVRGEKLPVYDYLMYHRGPEGSYKDSDGVVRLLSGGEEYLGIRTVPELLGPNSKYFVTYTIQKNIGDIVTLGGHLSISDSVKVTLDGKPVTLNYYENENVYNFDFPNDDKEHVVTVSFNTNNWDSNFVQYDVEKYRAFYIQPNRQVWGLPYQADVSKIELLKL